MANGGAERWLQAVGVGPADQVLYRALLERPGSSVEQLAKVTGGSAGRVRRGIARLEDLGLASGTPGVPRRYSATLPEAAIEALLHRREQALEQARSAAAELTALYRESMSRARPGGLVEVVRGREAVARRFLQLQKSARCEMDVFDAPPYATPENVAEAEVLGRGVRYRAIYAAPALELPGKLDAVLDLVAAGEQARVLPSVPVKLAVADRALALLPLGLDARSSSDGAVVVHPSPLLEALVTLFALLWDRATPIGVPTAGGGPGLDPGVDPGTDAGTDPGPGPEDRRLLALLTAGCKDEAIARHLGMSPRTVRRRVRRMMEQLGAGTRFQAGLQAVRRGWV